MYFHSLFFVFVFTKVRLGVEADITIYIFFLFYWWSSFCCDLFPCSFISMFKINNVHYIGLRVPMLFSTVIILTSKMFTPCHVHFLLSRSIVPCSLYTIKQCSSFENGPIKNTVCTCSILCMLYMFMFYSPFTNSLTSQSHSLLILYVLQLITLL